MKKRVISVFVILLLVVCLNIFVSCLGIDSQFNDIYLEDFSKKKYTPSEIFDYAEGSVAEIVTYDKKGNELALGSGFIYSEDGKIVTNYHVINGAYSATVNLKGVSYTVSQILAYDKNIDVAVLKIFLANGTKLHALPTCDKEVATGSSVYAIGSSKGLTATISNGIITHSLRDMEGVTCIQHNAAISSGNSGGPLINEYGEVIGINTFTLKDSQNLNFAIFVSELDKLSYSAPLTMTEFYEKEYDAFTKLKNYILKKGTYDSENRDYELELDIQYVSANQYIMKAIYDVEKDEIELVLYIFSSSSGYCVFIDIDEVDGVYDWSYIDSDDYYMEGSLYAATYSKSTLLGYSYNNIDSYSLRDSIRTRASSMVEYICSRLDSSFEEIGITAADLGFYKF